MKGREAVELLKDVVLEWNADNVSTLSAALAYYTLLSLAPLLVLITGLIQLVFGSAAVNGAFMQQVGSIIGPDGARTLQRIAAHAQGEYIGYTATGVSIVVLVISVFFVFYQLQTSLNTVWEVTETSTITTQGIIRRLSSFAIIPVIGFLLVVSTAASAAVAAFGNFLGGLFPGLVVVLHALNFLLSFVVITVLLALVYKIVPDVRIAWHDVWLGAAVTSLLFAVGRFAIGLYLGKSSYTSIYGAAGTLVVLVAWVYYSSQIFFIGAEFTQIYANRYGRRIVPTEGAEALPGQDPADRSSPSAPYTTGHPRQA